MPAAKPIRMLRAVPLTAKASVVMVASSVSQRKEISAGVDFREDRGAKLIEELAK